VNTYLINYDEVVRTVMLIVVNNLTAKQNGMGNIKADLFLITNVMHNSFIL
jgi:hypothetical protein